MTRDLTAEVFAALRTVAPEIDPTHVDRHAVLVESLDLDSMDFLNFMEALGTRLAIDIPEADHPRIRSIDALVAYLASRGAG